MAAAPSVLFVTAQLGPDLPGTNVTATRHNRLPHVSFNTESAQLVIGIVLAVAGNLVISLGLNVQKYVHNMNELKPEAERRPFTSNPIWWLGLSGTIAGEVGNFLAFGFAGADIVTPLGAVAVVSNAVIACVFLGELFRIRDALGVLLTCLGTVLIVIKAPASDLDMSVPLFLTYATNPIFVGYIGTVALTGLLIWRLLPRLQARHPAYGLLLCSLLGTVTVLCSTALSNFIRVTVNGDQQFGSWVPYALIVIAVPCGIGQVTYLNSTMELFDNTQVVPIYYILFTLSTITGSAMLYQDFDQKAADAVVVFVLGCLLCFAGVSLLTSGRMYVDDDLDAAQAVSDSTHRLELEANLASIECSANSSADEAARAKRTSLKTVRHALRHLDSPLFRGGSHGAATRFALEEGMTRADSFDSLYETLGRDANICGSLPSSNARRIVRRPYEPHRVSDAPFGGGEHALVFAMQRRSCSEDGRLPARAPRGGERGGPPLPTHRRSHSDGGARGGPSVSAGMEAGLLEEGPEAE